MQKVFLYGLLINALSQPHMKHSYIRVFSTARPQKDTLALIEPRIITADTLIEAIPQDEIWQTLIVARTVTHWCNKTKSGLVQVCNPSDRSIILKPKTVVSTISLVTAILPRNASAIANNHSESSQARIDLAEALDEPFKRSTFNDHQQTQLLDLCKKYRSVFSLTSKELGKCTIAEAEFPSQKHTSLSQWIITRIGRIQEHKKWLINVLRAWSRMALHRKESKCMGINCVYRCQSWRITAFLCRLQDFY